MTRERRVATLPGMPPIPDPLDVTEPRARQALARFRIERVGPDRFAEVHAVLDAEFGPRGEIERVEVLRDAARRRGPPTWHLFGAWDEDGRLAGARDCWVSPGPEGAVVYLAHSIVLPPWRRSGLAGLLRAVPATLGREAAHGGEVLLALEQEFYRPDAPDTQVRLVAYGRAGYSAIPPEVLPYCQPDFRDVAALGVPARPLPLVAVVRRVGHEGAPTLPTTLATAYLEHLYGIFATHCRAEDLAGPLALARDALRRAGPEVPLVPLPASLDDHEAFARLSWERAAPHFAALGL